MKEKDNINKLINGNIQEFYLNVDTTGRRGHV